MEGLDGGFKMNEEKDAVGEIKSNSWEEAGLEGMTDITGTRGAGGDGVGGMGGNEGAGKELGAEEGEVVFYGEYTGFSVKMTDISHLHASSGNSEGMVLNYLESIDGGGGSIWEPCWGGICEQGADEGFECNNEGFPLLAPIGASKGAEDIESGSGTGDDG